MARTQRQIEYIVMVKAGYECQPESACRHTVTFASMVCYAEVLFQSSYVLVSVSTLPAEHETFNALVGIWSEERSTPSITKRDSAQTERVLTRLVVHSPSPRQPSVSSQRSENMLGTGFPKQCLRFFDFF